LVRRCEEKVAFDCAVLDVPSPSKALTPSPILSLIHIAILSGKKAPIDLPPNDRLIKEGALRGP